MNNPMFQQIDPAAVDFTNAPLFAKTAIVRAHKAERDGIEVRTLISTPFGDMVETVKTAKQGDWIVTAILSGESYIMSEGTFISTYNKTDKPDIYNPILKIKPAVRLMNNNVFMAPWGDMMFMLGGSVLVRPNPDKPEKTYGIARIEMELTHARVNKQCEELAPAGIPLLQQRAILLHKLSKNLGDSDDIYLHLSDIGKRLQAHIESDEQYALMHELLGENNYTVQETSRHNNYSGNFGIEAPTRVMADAAGFVWTPDFQAPSKEDALQADWNGTVGVLQENRECRIVVLPDRRQNPNQLKKPKDGMKCTHATFDSYTAQWHRVAMMAQDGVFQPLSAVA